jgi:hypothetical protein
VFTVAMTVFDELHVQELVTVCVVLFDMLAVADNWAV